MFLDKAKDFILQYAVQILLYVIVFLLSIISFLAISLYFASSELDDCRNELHTISVVSKKERDRYASEIKSFEEAQKSIVKFYDGKIIDIDNFSRRSDETECEAASRLFDRAKY